MASDNPSLDRLKTLAASAAAHAYCPYSGFRVGAAVEAADGRVFTGCNVENASYGLACCAERNAIFKAVSEGVGPGDIRRIVIYTPTGKPFTSCGACRQVMMELASDAEVISTCDGADTVAMSVSETLKQPFSLSG